MAKRNKRVFYLRQALRMIEDIAANNLDEARNGYSDIYSIAHGISTCHDGCPVKKQGFENLKAWIDEQKKFRAHRKAQFPTLANELNFEQKS